MAKKIGLVELECKRCGHIWTPRKEKVEICPECKSKYWDEEPDK